MTAARRDRAWQSLCSSAPIARPWTNQASILARPHPPQSPALPLASLPHQRGVSHWCVCDVGFPTMRSPAAKQNCASHLAASWRRAPRPNHCSRPVDVQSSRWKYARHKEPEKRPLGVCARPGAPRPSPLHGGQPQRPHADLREKSESRHHNRVPSESRCPQWPHRRTHDRSAHIPR